MKLSTHSGIINPCGGRYVLAGFDERPIGAQAVGLSDLRYGVFWLKSIKWDLILISIDTLYVGSEIAEQVRRHLKTKYNVDGEGVVFNATHTHGAPSTALERFGRVDQEYVQTIWREINKGLDVCAKTFSETKITFKKVHVGRSLFINRRRFGRDIKSFFLKSKMLMLPNPDQEIDEFVRLLEFSSSEDGRQGVLANLSCHPVFSSANHLSSDYPGVLVEALKNERGGAAMFLQGFCGDIRPNFQLSGVWGGGFVNRIKQWVNGSAFATLDRAGFDKFCKGLSDKLALMCNASGEILDTSVFKIKKFTFTLPSDSGETFKVFSTRLVRIGKLVIVSIPAEVTSSYFVSLSQKFVGFEILPLGYADDIIGYLPYPFELEQGGYEVASTMNYGWDDRMSSDGVKAYVSTLESEIEQLIQSC